MPLYEYDCETCGETIEVLQRAGAPAPAACGEDCALDFGDAFSDQMGAGRLQRLMSTPSAHVVGAPRPRMSVRSKDPECGHCGEVPGTSEPQESTWS